MNNFEKLKKGIFVILKSKQKPKIAELYIIIFIMHSMLYSYLCYIISIWYNI